MTMSPLPVVEDPLVSVVIPSFRQAAFLAETLRSVFAQTWPHLEAIVVDDASPDETPEVIATFDDPRLVYIRHDTNRGLPESRNTGMRAARGELIAWLDADDVYHPEKLEAHVAFLRANPAVGFTYSARFEWNHSQTTIRDLFRPPLAVDLLDLVRWFPFCPSEVVMRREWPFTAGLFDPARGSAEDTDLPCRMALAGCRFASVDRALNYRRYHSGRGRRNLAGRLADVSGVLEAVFADPRCPDHVRAARDTALKVHLMDIVSLSLRQEETALAQHSVRRLVRMDPTMLQGSIRSCSPICSRRALRTRTWITSACSTSSSPSCRRRPTCRHTARGRWRAGTCCAGSGTPCGDAWQKERSTAAPPPGWVPGWTRRSSRC